MGGAAAGSRRASLAVTAPFMDLRFHPETKTTVDAILAAFSVPLDRSMRQFVGFENTTVQTPISYLPQSLGMRLGKALDLGPLTLLYLGRGANLIASLLVILLAIRAAPVFKWVFVLIALMPMAVFEMASVSADAFTNAIALLFTAMILRLALTESDVDARALAALLVDVPAPVSFETGLRRAHPALSRGSRRADSAVRGATSRCSQRWFP